MHPGARTCFAMAECRGWRWGRVHGEGSAGSSLRSLRKLWEVGAFALCARGFGVRFQGSLRPVPAAAGRICGGYAGRLCAGEAFAVPQRGTAYQPGVKPRVWRTTGAF